MRAFDTDKKVDYMNSANRNLVNRLIQNFAYLLEIGSVFLVISAFSFLSHKFIPNISTGMGVSIHNAAIIMLIVGLSFFIASYFSMPKESIGIFLALTATFLLSMFHSEFALALPLLLLGLIISTQSNFSISLRNLYFSTCALFLFIINFWQEKSNLTVSVLILILVRLVSEMLARNKSLSQCLPKISTAPKRHLLRITTDELDSLKYFDSEKYVLQLEDGIEIRFKNNCDSQKIAFTTYLKIKQIEFTEHHTNIFIPECEVINDSSSKLPLDRFIVTRNVDDVEKISSCRRLANYFDSIFEEFLSIQEVNRLASGINSFFTNIESNINDIEFFIFDKGLANSRKYARQKGHCFSILTPILQTHPLGMGNIKTEEIQLLQSDRYCTEAFYKFEKLQKIANQVNSSQFLLAIKTGYDF